MKQQKSFFKKDSNSLQTEKRTAGFVMLMIIPAFLMMLAFATAIAGSLSYALQVMSYRNIMTEAYSVLEDGDPSREEETVPVSWEETGRTEYEKVISVENMGPYVLLIKELRDKRTGKILVNRLEFMPIGKTDDRKSG